MARGIKTAEPDARVVYSDIINLPHWQSPTRQHMSLYDRAAQFAPFSALSGYDEMVTEEARLTDGKIELGESALEVLNQKLTLVSDVISDGYTPTLTFTVFVPDERKAGGKYVEITDKVKKIDAVSRKVVLMSKTGASGMNKTIDIDKIIDIHGKLVDYMDTSL